MPVTDIVAPAATEPPTADDGIGPTVPGMDAAAAGTNAPMAIVPNANPLNHAGNHSKNNAGTEKLGP